MIDQYAHIPAYNRFHMRSSSHWVTGFLISKSRGRIWSSFEEELEEAVASVDHAINPDCRCYGMNDNDEDERLVTIVRDCPVHR